MRNCDQIFAHGFVARQKCEMSNENKAGKIHAKQMRFVRKLIGRDAAE